MNEESYKQGLGMVDVGEKDITKRTAKACACLRMGEKAYQLLMSEGSPKGDVFETARIAGIMAAKGTPQIIPLCHPLSLNKVNIRFETDEKASIIEFIAEVTCHGRTGVEMEALCAVSVAALTVYDMMKWADKGMEIGDIKLLEKQGGKSGVYRRA